MHSMFNQKVLPAQNIQREDSLLRMLGSWLGA